MICFTDLLFDLDGTLTNPRQGIGNSLKYALDQMKIDGYSDEILEKFVGPPLQQGFKAHFSLNNIETTTAVNHFRKYFGEKGMFENEVYHGINELLSDLTNKGCRVYVVPSKLEKYAKMIVSHFGLEPYLTDLKGAEASGDHSGKGKLISELMDRNHILPGTSVVMIGDTTYDLKGAKENLISSIAVGYGFGIKEELVAIQPDYFVETTDDLARLLLK